MWCNHLGEIDFEIIIAHFENNYSPRHFLGIFRNFEYYIFPIRNPLGGYFYKNLGKQSWVWFTSWFVRPGEKCFVMNHCLMSYSEWVLWGQHKYVQGVVLLSFLLDLNYFSQDANECFQIQLATRLNWRIVLWVRSKVRIALAA